jgi:hypothetical protein
VYNGQRQVLGTDDTCPQGSLSLLERKVEVAVSIANLVLLNFLSAFKEATGRAL